MPLTPKQEKFCQCIASGMSGKDSYIAAYDTKGHANTAYTESNKLLLRDDIQKKITSLRKPIEQAAQIKAISARDEQIEYIKQRIALCEQKDDEQSIIRYTDMLNKINALYKDNDQDKQEDNKLASINTEALQRLVTA